MSNGITQLVKVLPNPFPHLYAKLATPYKSPDENAACNAANEGRESWKCDTTTAEESGNISLNYMAEMPRPDVNFFTNSSDRVLHSIRGQQKYEYTHVRLYL